MKKSIIKSTLFLLFLASSIMVNAQDDVTVEENENADIIPAQESKQFEHQFGFNATQFIQTLFGISGFNPPSPYQVNYKFLINTKPNCFVSSYGFRAGYGQVKIHDKVTQNTNNFFNTTNLSQTNLRLGIEAQKRLNDKWLVFAGIDYTSFKSVQESESVFDNPPTFNSNIFTQNEKSSGVGPVFGVQFSISKYIVLNTELSFYMTNGTSSTKQETNFNGNINTQSTEREMKSSNIIIPAFVNFNFRF